MYGEGTCECCRSYRSARSPLAPYGVGWWCKKNREDEIDPELGRCRHYADKAEEYDQMRQRQKDAGAI